MSDCKKTVLVTGAGGVIGRMFPRHYEQMYRFRLLDNREVTEAVDGAELFTADLSDHDALASAMAGVDAVVHLAADSHPAASWESVLANNISGVHSVFEAARVADVRRVVYASSIHACAEHMREFGHIGPDAPARADSLYGASKVFGETLARFYSDCHGLSVVCLRIGSCARNDDHERQRYHFQRMLAREWSPAYEPWQHLGIWISQRDMAQLLYRSIEASVQFGIFYGCSDNDPSPFDLTETRSVLGYAPVDSVQTVLGESYGPKRHS